MSEIVVDVKDIQKTLEPMFEGNTARIVLVGKTALISFEAPPKERPRERMLKARGICSDAADISGIPGERGAWGDAVIEKYVNNKNS